MVTVHPQFITDTAGQKMVVLPATEFKSIMDELEEIEDIRLYDEAISEDDGERIQMDEAFEMIEAKRKNKE